MLVRDTTAAYSEQTGSTQLYYRVLFFKSVHVHCFCYIGKQEDVEATTEAVKAIGEPISTFVTVLLDICAYAGTCIFILSLYLSILLFLLTMPCFVGTGNVLKIQSLLHICSEYFGSDADEEEGTASGGKKAGSKEGEKPSSTSSSSDGSAAPDTGWELHISYMPRMRRVIGLNKDA